MSYSRFILLLVVVSGLSACAVAPVQRPGTAGAAPLAPAQAAAASPVNTPATAAAPDSQATSVPPAATADAVPEDLWARIRAGFRMSSTTDIARLHENEAWYENRPAYVQRMVQRSKLYLYYVVKEVEARGMPSEIALLPMIESAYNPRALSPAQASGIWQFVPQTGRNFGLHQNWWYDGRRDIRAATDAALNYLQQLHTMFGNWKLALAAYNAGEGAVARAIAHNRARGRPTNYESLPLPEQTRNYVPRLLAVKNIVMDPAKYGITLQSIPNKPYFSHVALQRRIDIKLAAKLAEISVHQFEALNPAYNRPVIRDAHGRADPPTILLPVDQVAVFKANLASYDKPLSKWAVFHMPRNEPVVRVARDFRMTPAALRAVNGVSPRDRILRVGKTLLVPRDHAQQGALLAANYVPVRTSGATHIVRRGDTLYSLAQRYRVSVSKLRAWNGIRHGDLRAGQRLVIRTANHESLALLDRRILRTATHYTVRLGDTLYSLAQRYRVSVSELRAWNGIRHDDLKPGQRLVIRTARHEGVAMLDRHAPGARTRYTVRSGDTLGLIARRFNVALNQLQRWNDFSSHHVLHPGERVTVYLQETASL
ncbi:MAG: LysM peptidoglycan-binding domain-containing protein [Betaproteobacteria bacterium]|nr:LysM peptidoglycan-binding domain-containing protein [Betaproteobacteria bacterium]